ncbi:MAG: hypothetical protein NVSMB6_09690 [Burkholderiaceae bacterium]
MMQVNRSVGSSALRLALSSALLLTDASSAASGACSAANVQTVEVEIHTRQIVRAGVPKELFGFNVPWSGFQKGYFRNGAVRPELLDYLAAFPGAVYRFPGGSPSNWFEWKKTVGPVAQRPPMHSEFGRYAVAKFGLSEFANFVGAVNGRALITLNLAGPYQTNPRGSVIAADAVALMLYVANRTSLGCTGGLGCKLMAWELGNELDWGPYHWSAQTYSQRAKEVLEATAAIAPRAVWIVNGATAPWDATSSGANGYNASLASHLGGRAKGIAIHPYYDGISVPSAAAYVAEFGKTWARRRPDAKVYVTEHGRWPTKPLLGTWESNWYQATGLGGAISSADFVISLIGNPAVAAAAWHALSIEGPWQLIRLNAAKDVLYPSPVYWGLRALREGFLDQVVETRYSPPGTADYGGGYDLRLVGMTSVDGRQVSLLGVNRSKSPFWLRIRLNGKTPPPAAGVVRLISGNSQAEDNTDEEPQKVAMRTQKRILDPSMPTADWCVPGNAVFSILEN